MYRRRRSSFTVSGLIWTSLAIFTTDMVLQHRQRP
jgi:hypothetical protein